jgi:4-hydroxybenzoate polyprenyltransferase
MTRITATPEAAPLARIRRYRRLFFGSVLAGVLAALALRFLGYPLLGEAIYWVGLLLAVGIWLGSSTPLFDERDAALERRASQVTISVFAVVLIVGASAARVLPRVSDVVVPPEVVGALYGYVALFAVFAVSYLWFRYRP